MRDGLFFIYVIGLLLAALSPVAAWATDAGGKKNLSIYCPPGGSVQELLAAREVRRYVYLLTGALLPIMETAELPAEGAGIVVARKGSALARSIMERQFSQAGRQLEAQQYLLKTVEHDGRRLVLIVGGDGSGTLFGAYRFAEHLGIRFYLHDDTVPDGRIALELPLLDEKAGPLFALRGIQPFHDFPEGPDWWNADDYKAVIAQLPKLRMNFIGLHTYPENAPGAEPTVWIGLAGDASEDGSVAFSYPSNYANTARGGAWGYSPKPTNRFAAGGANLFDRDDFGPDVLRGHTPQPSTPEGGNEVFDRTAAMLRDAFTFARLLGVKTCAGTETPLTIPKLVRQRLESKGLKAADPAVRQKLYEGIFTRIMGAYPLDYYWLWTPEGWTWQGASKEQVQATYDDVKAAVAAAQQVKAPFKLATCGWVLGPQEDRSAFDRVFPKEMPISCINRQVGMTPVDRGFADVTGRDKWAIPWMEDDPALTSPQLWVGRMRRDAADAKQYGCTGLMGIHWRTRILGPNVLALARAGWDQSGWSGADRPSFGPLGGAVANYPNNPIQGTKDAPLYQTVRYDLRGYRIPAPDGRYKVTLKFCEPHYARAGVRVFDVVLGGRRVINQLDIFAKVGQNKALDYTFDDIEVTHGRLDIDFVYRVEFPCIAAIVVEGPNYVKKINCGGPAYKDYEADPAPIPDVLPSGEFYLDWATAEFGPAAAGQIAAIFEKVDCRLPRPSDWVDGPGGIRPDARPWSDVLKEYAFVGELEALRPRVTGPASLERFYYWLNTFRYMRAIGRVRCIWGEYEAVMAKVRAEKDAAVQKRLAVEQALPVRQHLVPAVVEVYQHLLSVVNTPGELGTVANWDQHIQPMLLDKPGAELAKILGRELPADADLPRDYVGAPRLIVPTLRTSLAPGETLAIKAIVLDNKPAREVTAYWRPMGSGEEFKAVPFAHAARCTYSVTFPTEATRGDLEYHLKAVADGGQTLGFPAGAPDVNRTVIVLPEAKHGQ